MNTTIALITSDIFSPWCRKCIDAVKKYSTNYEFIIIENNLGSQFKLSREINRIMSITKNKYLITLDDDVIVTRDWINSLVKSAQENHAAIVGCTHRYSNKTINHAGGFFLLNPYIILSQHISDLNKDCYFPYVCSAVMLIDINLCKSNDIRFSENLLHYYIECDFCLKAWEKGLKVVCTPRCDVIHIRDEFATLRRRSAYRQERNRKDVNYFKRKWIFSKRLEKLLRKRNRVFFMGGISTTLLFNKLMYQYIKASINKSIMLFKKVLLGSKPLVGSMHGNIFAGLSCYRIGLLYQSENKKAAVFWFKKTLNYLPEFNKARKLISILLNKSRFKKVSIKNKWLYHDIRMFQAIEHKKINVYCDKNDPLHIPIIS